MGAPLPHGSTAQMRLRCIARLDRSDGPHRRSSARPTDLVANFTANPVNYTIALSASPSAGGTVSGGGTFTAGTPHTVTATANSGYTFAHWTDNGAVVQHCGELHFHAPATATLWRTSANARSSPAAPARGFKHESGNGSHKK